MTALEAKKHLINDRGFITLAEYSVTVPRSLKEPKFKLTRMIHSESKTSVIFEESKSGAWRLYLAPTQCVQTGKQLERFTRRLKEYIE